MPLHANAMQTSIVETIDANGNKTVTTTTEATVHGQIEGKKILHKLGYIFYAVTIILCIVTIIFGILQDSAAWNSKAQNDAKPFGYICALSALLAVLTGVLAPAFLMCAGCQYKASQPGPCYAKILGYLFYFVSCVCGIALLSMSSAKSLTPFKSQKGEQNYGITIMSFWMICSWSAAFAFICCICEHAYKHATA